MATTRPQPPAPAHLIPAQISASGYNSLMTCPYQFYARHLLKLGEEAEVQELIEKRDYGLLVHDVLKRFHGAHPLVSQLNTDEALGELTAFSEHAFAEAIRNNYLASAWLARWKVLIPDYLAWQRAREAQGWRWKAAEEDRHIEIDTPGGRKLILRGRIDRVDEDGQARIAVLDYKTQRKDILRKKLREPGEDVQLPVYALLWGGPVAEALFLSIEREGVGEIRPRYDLEEVAQSSRERLGLMYDALHEQAPLPAQGAEEDCQYCEAQGLCRRQHWP
jgi:ATP-dependent helicase/nuclease subunit B